MRPKRKRPTRPLLRRGLPLEGESLTSYLLRLGQQNHYDPIHIPFWLWFDAMGWGARLTYPFSQMAVETGYDVASTLTGCSPKELYALTVHPTAELVTSLDKVPSELVLEGQKLFLFPSNPISNTWLHPEGATQWCPQCLSEVTYHRCLWLQSAVTVCLEHRCLLLNRCPTCTRKIRILDLLKRACPGCHTDLAEVLAHSLKSDARGLAAQGVIQAWLKGLPGSASGYGLPKQPSRVLFQILWSLRCTTSRLPIGHPLLHVVATLPQITKPKMGSLERLTPAQAHIFTTTAFDALVNWPHGFEVFLHAYRGCQDNGANCVLYEDFGRFHHELLVDTWLHPAYQFIQDAFNTYLVTHYQPSLSLSRYGRLPHNAGLTERFTMMSLGAAADLLGVHKHTLRKFAKVGAVKAQRDNSGTLLFDRETVLCLEKTWADFMHLNEASRRLGLSEPTFGKLIDGELIRVVRRLDMGKRCVLKSDVQAVLDGLAVHVVQGPPNEVTFTNLTRRVWKCGVGIADILRLVISGRLPATSVIKRPRVHDLSFSRTDIEAIRDAKCRI